MAYLTTTISGNKSFGGYLSIDGTQAVSIEDDMTYEIAPGQHHVRISSTSDAKQKMANAQAFVYMNTSSSGAILDALERRQIASGFGDSWEFQFMIEETQEINIDILTNGNSIVSAPMYGFRDLDEEEYNGYKELFEKIRNTPRRKPKQIVWGSILTVLGLIFGICMTASGNTAGGIFMMQLIPVGILLFCLGIKKKVRK